jgi:hypothetical protein
MELREEIDGEVSKTQVIRLLDVFGIGPLMIYAGMKCEDELPKWARFALVASGVATIGYNGMNYLEQEQLKEDRIRAVQEAIRTQQAQEAE